MNCPVFLSKKNRGAFLRRREQGRTGITLFPGVLIAVCTVWKIPPVSRVTSARVRYKTSAPMVQRRRTVLFRSKCLMLKLALFEILARRNALSRIGTVFSKRRRGTGIFLQALRFV